MRDPARATRIAGWALALGAVAIRLNNAVRYPVDWGFDGPYVWRYIYRISIDWTVPPPDAGWATSDPPLFFFAAAALLDAFPSHLVLIPLLSAAAGLGVAALAVALVRRLHPGDDLRALLAGGLVLYLPAHVQMSAMVNEETLVAFLTSLVLYLLATAGPPRPSRAAAIGAAVGLATLTKLSGVLAGVTAVLSFVAAGVHRAALAPALRAAALLCAVAFLCGGWYYARNLALYGYVQPFGLPAHRAMFQMPPGERGVGDYLRVPLATFTDPQLLDPELLHSVWGSTFATIWFDGHRYFLPRDSDAVRRLGTAMLLLALLPSAAFAVGLGRAARRAWRAPGGADLPLLLMVPLTLAGYALYTWRNPWFATVKGTSLLVLSLPFAYYASESLATWLRRSRRLAVGLGAWLAALVLLVSVSYTFGLVFEKSEVSGLPWVPARHAVPDPMDRSGAD